MSWPVGDKFYQIAVGAGLRAQGVEQIADGVHDFQISAFASAADGVGGAGLAAFSDERQGADVILDVEPVAHVVATAVNRQGLAFKRVQDYERNQLFRELVRAVVVGAVGDYNGQAIGVKPGAGQMVGAGFTGGVGRSWIVRRGFAEWLSVGSE